MSLLSDDSRGTHNPDYVLLCISLLSTSRSRRFENRLATAELNLRDLRILDLLCYICKLRLASTPYIWWIPLIPMIERSCAWILVYIRDRSWPGGPRTYTVLGNPTAPSSVAEIVVRSTASEPSSAGSMSSPGKTSPLPCLAGLSPWSRIASRGPCWWTRACTRTMRRGQHVGHRRGRGPA